MPVCVCTVKGKFKLATTFLCPLTDGVNNEHPWLSCAFDMMCISELLCVVCKLYGNCWYLKKSLFSTAILRFKVRIFTFAMTIYTQQVAHVIKHTIEITVLSSILSMVTDGQ